MKVSGDSPFVLSDAKLQSQRRRVFSIEVGGARYYVKTDKVRKYHVGHRAQSLLYRASHNPLLAPTIFPDIASSMAYEVKKLKRLREKKLPVPEVVYQEPRYFVTRDVGTPLHKVIRKDREKAHPYALKAMGLLARLHRGEIAHGGTQLKNFTLKEESVYLIDFEENVERVEFEDMRLRDFMLFLIHVESMQFKVSYAALIGHYEETSELAIRHRLLEMARRYRILRIVDNPMLNPFGMKDLRAFARVLAKLAALEAD